MRHWSESRSFRVKLLALAVFLLPTAVFLGILHGPLLRLAEMRQEREAALAALRENVYRKDWLDSTRRALSGEVEDLRRLHARVRRALSSENRPEAISDPLRREAQAQGWEVLRVSASQDSAGPLRRARFRWEARADYPAALRLLRVLRENRPDLYLEEALIRNAAGSGKLSLQVTWIVHLAGEAGAAP